MVMELNKIMLYYKYSKITQQNKIFNYKTRFPLSNLLTLNSLKNCQLCRIYSQDLLLSSLINISR